MSRLILLAAAVAALSPLAPAQQTSTSSLAREAYEDRLSQNLRQLRQEVDAASRGVPLPGQQRFAPIYDALNSAEQALADLKTSSALDQPAARKAAEASIARVRRLWSDFRLVVPAQRQSAQATTETGSEESSMLR